ncbi:M16 family metallopeptidase [Actinomycetospora termitidis]|uniref:Pitrilysin family protein n=1 Tax=Actinomycetospora termitidis TaxID=3053470 RepID=A0ABT7M995_9PSEU|nr:pitrilysin family protein [Actinomycetospora sp. Odt1-22]MDL5157253.1 pitrilysin family protein [Actinomycetospora sp. Odt1-22]
MTAPTTADRRSAEEIGRTEAGPRELPPLRPQPEVPAPDEADTVLTTGLRVIAVRRPGVPMVEVRLRIPFSGEGSEDPRYAAVAEVLASTVLSGTTRRSRVSLDDDLAGVGGEMGFSVDPERLAAAGHALADGLPTLLDVLADVLAGATYPADEVTRERERLAERIQVASAQPSVIARRALQRHRYGDHPVTREMPEVDDVASVTPDDLLATHRRKVVPRGSVLVLVGDIDPTTAVAAAEAALASWDAPGEAGLLPSLPALHGSELLLVDRPGAVQSQLRLSAAAVARTDPRYPALQLANLAFGGYFSSRLVENLREDKGYTYHASSSLEFDPYGAALLVETDCASEVTAPALLEMRYELGRAAVVPPSESELESARRYAVGSLLISLNTQAGLASTLAGLAGVGLDSGWVREHPRRLEAVTPDEVAAAAVEFLAPSRFTGVVVADAARSAESLRALGGIRVP